MNSQSKTIIISRTDSIGDVVLTLPVAGILKQYFPDCKIVFLGNTYTKPIIDWCKHVDIFLNNEELKGKRGEEVLRNIRATDIIHVFPNSRIARLANQADIPNRVGTSRRIFHWYFCNRMVHLSRKKSTLHEAQLNLELLAPFSISKKYSLDEIVAFYGIENPYLKEPKLSTHKKKLILHPKSKGSAREWGAKNYIDLIRTLDTNQFDIYITGTQQEKQAADEICKPFTHVNNLCGTLTLNELIQFIAKADALIACSTGPLHIAAALGIVTIGLYAPIKPIFPQRWAPIGSKANYLVVEKMVCSNCKDGTPCACIMQISATEVYALLMQQLQ